jgi:hypothetical protein
LIGDVRGKPLEASPYAEAVESFFGRIADHFKAHNDEGY